MIIQCKQCKTKFRFDDALMEGDGLWLRCSRCQHVFFHDHPAKVKPVADDLAESSVIKAPDQEAEKVVKRPSFEPAVKETVKETVAGSQDEDMKSFMNEVIGEEKTPQAEASIPAVSTSAALHQPEMHVEDIDFLTAREEVKEAQEAQEAQEPPAPQEEMPERQAPPPKKKNGILMLVLWVVLFNVFIFALLYFFAPQVMDHYVQIAQKYVGVGSQATEGQVVVTQIRLQDIRQRMVNNLVLGNVRVVEGTAVNQADFAVSRVRVKGEILANQGVVLGERASFAGNILTEEELANMSEVDMQKRLSRPEGRNNINEKVLPNGRIPFMIVFTREKQGAIKTTVEVSGAERLL